MGQPAARLTDMHTCPMVTGVVPHVGGPITSPGAPTVMTMGLPQARITDMCTCVGPPDVIVRGSLGVFAMGLPAARMGDNTVHGGVIIMGAPTVLIGDIAPGSVSPGAARMVEVLNNVATIGDKGAQARALIGANQQGSYFCKRCAELSAAGGGGQSE